MVPERHVKPQLPSEQVLIELDGPWQMIPQLPQWFALMFVFTQLEPHLVYGELQTNPQLPLLLKATEFVGALQVVPQPPQC